MRKTREETLRSRLADLASQIEQLDKARAETKAMLDVLVGLPAEQRQAMENYLDTVAPINPSANPDTPESFMAWREVEARKRCRQPVDDHYPIEPPGVFNPLAHEQSK